MSSHDDHVCAGAFGVERPLRSVWTIRASRHVLVGLVVAFCVWAVFVGAARAAVPGTISTVAGSATVGDTGDGGPATSAGLDNPSDVVVDGGGDLFISDEVGKVVRLVAGSNCATACPFGLTAMTKGDIYRLAGTGVSGGTGDGGPAGGAELADPEGLALDPRGDVLIADEGGEDVLLVARAYCARSCPYGLAVMLKGLIYRIAGDGAYGFNGDTGAAVRAQLDAPQRLAVDQAGNLVISDSLNQRVRLVADSNCSNACPYGLTSMTAGSIYTIAGDGTMGVDGDGGPATAAQLDSPDGITFDADGDLLVGNENSNDVRLVAETSCAFDCQYGLRSMTPGDIYLVAGKRIAGGGGYSGDDKPAATTELNEPAGMTIDGVGDLLIADQDNNRIRIVPDVACASACPYGLSALQKGFMYTVAGNGTSGFSGEGGPATSAEISGSRGIGIDGNGNLLIADTKDSRIQLVTASEPPPVCYETGAREVGQDGFTGTRDQEDVIVYAPAGLASISDVTVVNGTATPPTFTPGTKGPVIVTVTKTVQSGGVSGYYKATDKQGRYSFCGFYLPTG